jgi:ATP-binding cassette subfamily B protein
MIKGLIDRGIVKGDVAYLHRGAIIIVVITLGRAVFDFYRSYLTESASQGVAYELRNALYRHTQHLSFSWHDRSQTGQLMTRMTSDVELVRLFTGRGLLNMANFAVVFTTVIVVLFSLNWPLALLSLATLPPLVITIAQYNRIVRPMFIEIQQQLAAVTTVLQEIVTGIKVVKAFAREPFEADRFAEQNDLLLDKNIVQVKASAIVMPLLNFWSAAGSVLVIGAGTAPANATGWNAYAGNDPGALALLNSTPMPIGISFTWLAGTVGGRAPAGGQSPNLMRVLPRMWQRG